MLLGVEMRDVGITHHAAKLCDQCRQRQNPGIPGLGCNDVEIGGRVVRVRVTTDQFVHEPRRHQVGVPRSRFDCGDQQTATSTATGDQEQPAFFGQKRRGSRESFGSRVTAVGDSVDQVDQRFGTQ